MIKKLSELKISPTPWTSEVNEDDQLMIYDAEEHEIGQCFGSGNDARLIAAAPKLYEALRKITEEQECGKDCRVCKNDLCVIQECKAALAEAAGEEVAE